MLSFPAFVGCDPDDKVSLLIHIAGKEWQDNRRSTQNQLIGNATASKTDTTNLTKWLVPHLRKGWVTPKVEIRREKHQHETFQKRTKLKRVCLKERVQTTRYDNCKTEKELDVAAVDLLVVGKHVSSLRMFCCLITIPRFKSLSFSSCLQLTPLFIHSNHLY